MSAEGLKRAKAAGEATGIEIRHTSCSICSMGCRVAAYVKDEKVIKVEGSPDAQGKEGYLCAKGLSNRDYIYRKDRIKTPLKRVGKRGEGLFKEISWEEAYLEITGKLRGYRSDYGADSVAFFTGYSKWYRTIFHRFVHSFGTLNYGTESSSCFQAAAMANKIAAGTLARPDIANAGVFIAWGFNPYYSGNPSFVKFDEFKKRGLKIIVIDPRVTPFAQKYGDIFLRPRPGTDGALAHAFGNYFIEHNKIDRAYIQKHVLGFEEYREYVKQFDIETAEGITGIPGAQIIAAAEMIMNNGPLAINESAAPITHHRNGMQNYRAIIALSAITGNYDKRGGQIPSGYSKREKAGPQLLDIKFINEVRPRNTKPKIGSEKFPLWSELVDEFQAMDLSRQILEQTPYPIKAVFALGMNVRMFPDNKTLFKALEEVEYFVDVDLFLTDTAKYADIVLPACSSFERSELISKGNAILYTSPIIKPLYQAKSDVDIICELAGYLELEDELLKSGYENCCKYLLSEFELDFDELKASGLPTPLPGFKPYVIGENTVDGYATPSGKYELKSNIIAKYSAWGLMQLPVYLSSLDEADEVEYPLILTSGGRLPWAFHSRLHEVSWARSLRPEASVDISVEDGKSLRIKQGDEVEVITTNGVITVRANVSRMILKGVIHVYQDYKEADINSIIGRWHLDPYSGFPGYRTVRCKLRKKVSV